MPGLLVEFDMHKIGIYFIAFLALSACTREIELKEQDYEKKLVLNGLICPDSLISVRVSRTISILSNENPIIENATVLLYLNERYIETLQHEKNGRYKSETIYPKADSIYTIQVEVDGYPTIRATDTVPKLINIIYGTHASGNSYDEYGDPHQDYEIVIDDLPEQNFYELFFIFQYFPDEYFTKYYINFQIEPVVADPVLRSDSELDFFTFTYIFSDTFFNGKQYHMKNKFLFASVQGVSSHPYAPTPYERYAILRTTSYTYYNYRKYWIRHSNNQQIGNNIEDPLFMSLIGDPVSMYSNVEGGYGIFAAYNQTCYKLEEQ